MTREEKIYHVFNRVHELTIKNTFYIDWYRSFVDLKLSGDQVDDDITTLSLMIPITSWGSVNIVSKDNGIVAGIEEVKYLYEVYKLEVNIFKNDGDSILKGDIILQVSGSRKHLLEVERLGLNVLQRMSGVATTTYNYCSLINKHSNSKIAGTRKTLWRYLDKKAIGIGGGLTHRLNLNDNVLIKDNHLAMLKQIGFTNPVVEALKRAWLVRNKCRAIEIELSSAKDIFQAAEVIYNIIENDYYPFVIMLDNLSPKKINSIITQLKQDNLYEQILFEASGNISENNLIEYSICGVDVLSMGVLTHSAKNLDISQQVLLKS